MAAIVRLQHRFFITDDDEDIRPMVLRDISEATGYDLSTVSRATQGKYIATARGVYPLKKFFNGKLRADDDSLTSNRIISEIRRAIAGEAPDRPLSDREIARTPGRCRLRHRPTHRGQIPREPRLPGGAAAPPLTLDFKKHPYPYSSRWKNPTAITSLPNTATWPPRPQSRLRRKPPRRFRQIRAL